MLKDIWAFYLLHQQQTESVLSPFIKSSSKTSIFLLTKAFFSETTDLWVFSLWIVSFRGRCRRDSENAAKSATLWGSGKCCCGGGTRLAYRPAASRLMCRRDTWRSAWGGVAGDSWCRWRTWTILSLGNSLWKQRKSTGLVTKAHWRSPATSPFSKKWSALFPVQSRVTPIGSWTSKILKTSVTRESGVRSIRG